MILVRLLKKAGWVNRFVADKREKPLIGSQVSFAVLTVKAALNGDGKATKKANHSS